MNFKTVMRLARQAHLKKSFMVNGNRVVNADNYVMVWAPDTVAGTFDVNDAEVEDPADDMLRNHSTVIARSSPMLSGMQKFNSNYLRRIISAMETTGNEPVWLSFNGTHLCIAVDKDGDVHRGILMGMRND